MSYRLRALDGSAGNRPRAFGAAGQDLLAQSEWRTPLARRRSGLSSRSQLAWALAVPRILPWRERPWARGESSNRLDRAGHSLPRGPCSRASLTSVGELV